MSLIKNSFTTKHRFAVPTNFLPNLEFALTFYIEQTLKFECLLSAISANKMNK